MEKPQREVKPSLEVISNKNSNDAVLKKIEPKKSTFSLLFANILSILFWSYLIFKVFLFDFDIFLVNKYASNFNWIFNFKFLFFPILISLFLLFSRSKFLTALYILFFPLILLFFWIPAFIVMRRNWTLVIALLNLIINFFSYFKLNFILHTGLILSIIFIIFSQIKFLIILCVIYLSFYILYNYIRAIYLALKEQRIFNLYFKIISNIRKFAIKNRMFAVDEKIKLIPKDKLSKEQLTLYNNNLQMGVLTNRFCYYFAKKLEDYKKSNIDFISSLFNYVWILLQSIFLVSFVNLAIWKIDPNSFKFITKTPSWLIFLYYSLTSFYGSGIESLMYPTYDISIIVKMLSIIIGLSFIPVVLGTYINSIHRQKTNRNLEESIILIRNEGKELEKYIQSEYKYSIEEAIKWLVNFQTGFLSIINTMSKFAEEK